MKTRFSKKIYSKLSPEELWKEITSALHNSNGHPFWPTTLEESKCARLKHDALVHVKYKAVLTAARVVYRITTWNPDKHILHYEATATHPLRGGATIRVAQGINGGSELLWTGSYTYPWISPAGFFLRSYFLPRFFLKLRQNLRQFESESTAWKGPAKVHHLDERRKKKIATRLPSQDNSSADPAPPAEPSQQRRGATPNPNL